MGAAKPSKKQRGKKNAATKAKKKAAADDSSGTAATTTTSNQHVKFDDDGEKVTKASVLQKKRARAAEKNAAAEKKEVGGKADRSPEMIQQAKYYLEQWKNRNEPVPEGELPWKFKKMKQMWILRWMYEADVVPKSMFSIVLDYLTGIEGQARQRVLDAAHEIIDAGVPEKTGEEEEEDLPTRLARRRYKRALQVAERIS
uniref:WKF domain-containing protein n=1 Tax=Globisporangium ultimum (strain ATCC 200006 / CBS 805.95 / DAOM BR144) TaxID=431595 RepID=K3W776_GLOUD